MLLAFAVIALGIVVLFLPVVFLGLEDDVADWIRKKINKDDE